MPVLRHPSSLLIVLALLAPAGAFAEVRPDQTGTGGGPTSTITAPNTNALGVTKPPGVEEGPETPQERRELERIERRNQRIENGICDGCR
ncbi:hypothetical protein [Methylobacterium gnaphalii]|uniref:Uncharacterized protein n=1 Tax=Methylobacterium gnaphalii TaxID=1010610 RepID=A0A512JG80_9HYPH|nr:hypothetical protein [Methylobacterium gnaphalii]GEP08936.1 hypothetical protein MGN01_07810 [Methylobacterium gnaphalii]GJD70969.1 hypothetical protein MMMDOFMJ_3923 [Methylobacterium gnaphalii]GLS50419.1 hypothetical protein GCM10007885_32710 [Methylobacterium gnaphalii]